VIGRYLRILTGSAVAVMALWAGFCTEGASARTLSLTPGDRDLVYRRFRGDDEVTDHDRGRGGGRGQGRSGEQRDEKDSSGSNGSGKDSSGNGNGGHSGSSNDYSDSEDRFGK
jgi:hypothetical protein